MDKESWIIGFLEGMKKNREPSMLVDYEKHRNRSFSDGYFSARLAKAGVEPYELQN